MNNHQQAIAEAYVLLQKHRTTSAAISDTIDSLQCAVGMAGGTPEAFTANRLVHMNALELIAWVAPNGIRFHHDSRLETETDDA
jgi:hypothetical protein